MTLTINSNEDDKRQLVISVEVSEDRVQKQVETVIKKASRDMRVPGFRPGKAPMQMLRQLINMDAVREDAVNDLLPKAYEEAIIQFAEKIHSAPVVSEVEIKPFKFTIVAPLIPIVDLGDYYSYRNTVEIQPVSEEMVEQYFLSARQQFSTLQDVERPAKLGDTLLIHGSGNMVDDKTDVIYEEVEPTLLVLDEKNSPFEDTLFIEKLVGAQAGDTIEFSFVFPEGYDEVGQAAEFRIVVEKVSEAVLPELTDEFVARAWPGYATLDDVRKMITERFENQQLQKLKTQVVEGFIDELMDNIEELVYSPLLISHEVTGMIKQLKERVKQEKLNWDDFLKGNELTEKELFEDYEEKAVSRVERGLIFDKFIRQEEIILSESEYRNEVNKRVSSLPETIQSQYAKYLLTEEGRADLFVTLMTDKAYERILQIYAGEVTPKSAESLPAELPLPTDQQNPESDSEA